MRHATWPTRAQATVSIIQVPTVAGTATVNIYHVLILPVQSLCAQRFERPKLKISAFGVRKGLLIEKAPTEKMGGGRLVVPQIHLTEVQSSGFCMSREGNIGGAAFVNLSPKHNSSGD